MTDSCPTARRRTPCAVAATSARSTASTRVRSVPLASGMHAHTDCRRLPAACASCGYPAAKIRSYEWGQKAKRRKSAWLPAGATSAAAHADVSLLPQRPARAACATFPVCRAVPRTASAPVLPRARRPLPPRPKRLQRESPLRLLLPPALAALVHTVLLHVLITLCHHPSPSTPTCAPSGAPHTSDVHQQNFIWPFDR